jgi:hypothetical protein
MDLPIQKMVKSEEKASSDSFLYGDLTNNASQKGVSFADEVRVEVRVRLMVWVSFRVNISIL